MMHGQNLPPPPSYVMLQPPPYGAPAPSSYQSQRQANPRYQTRRSGCGCCLRCICCIYILLFIMVFALALALFLVYTFYQPKIPSYKVEDFTVSAFKFQPDMTVKAEFQVTIRAENPNTKIGFIYGQNNSIIISFLGSVICSGKLPAFEQGHQNITTLKIPLSGHSSVGSGVHNALLNDEHRGSIPLLIQVKVPVTVVLDTIPLRQFLFHVDCLMTVDDLRPDKKPRIISTAYFFRFGL